jgi:hypothetical protein
MASNSTQASISVRRKDCDGLVVSYNIQIGNKAACMAQWFEQRRKDLVILASPFESQCGNMGAAGPSDETVYTEDPFRSRCWHKKESSLLKAMSAKHRSKFSACHR